MLAHLRDGDRLEQGKVVGHDGAEVAVVPDERFADVQAMIEAGHITDTSQIPAVLARQT